ncbi:MAG: hypothetical protein H0V46_07320 [Sphingomonas sp.]|nr:hypothetical protein [Sphingomonas sp.]
MKSGVLWGAAYVSLFSTGVAFGQASPQVAASLSQSAHSPVGAWEGEVDTGKWPLFIALGIEPVTTGLGGKLEFLGQTAPLVPFSSDGSAFRIKAGKYIELVGRREGEVLVGHLIEGKDQLPFRLRAVPIYPKPRDRLEAWAQDLDALENRFLPADRSFSPGERALFQERLADIRAQLPQLTDAEVTMKMAAAIALAGNPHTRLYLLRNATELRRMPIRLWWFHDGLRVVRATDEHKKLVGCRVDSIGGRPARIARDMVAPAFAGTPSWVDYKSVYSLTSPEALKGTGVVENMESIDYGLSGCVLAGRVNLKPLPLVRSEDSVEAWWDLTPLHSSGGAGWVQALQSSRTKLPLYLQNPNKNYWFRYLPDSRTLYFQYNRSSDMKEENTEAFTNRLVAELQKQPMKSLVIDFRFNTGGNLHLGADLMKKLQAQTKGMDRWIITGRSTFSAGITHVASWREAGNVMIVGEPVGDGMEFWSEGGNIKLPNSGYDAHFANGRHSYSPAPCPAGIYCYDLSAASLDPEAPIFVTWAQYSSGRDPAMEFILSKATKRKSLSTRQALKRNYRRS